MGDTEHLASFQSILHHTVPIVSADSKDFSIGSGVLIEIEGRLFIATAYHCIRRNPVLLMDGMELTYRQGAPILPQPRIRILRSGGDPSIDIGLLELETGKSILSEAGYFSCSLDQVHTQKIPVTGPEDQPNPIHVAGWPRYSQDIQGERLFRTLEGFITRYRGSDQTHFYYDFGERAKQWDESRGGWEEKSTPSPVGFSGGGCWGIVKSKPGALYDPRRHIRLFAIQSAWTVSTRVVTAILIAEWLKLLYANVPDLRASLEAQFQDIRFQASC
jgi:hypothetical protein